MGILGFQVRITPEVMIDVNKIEGEVLQGRGPESPGIGSPEYMPAVGLWIPPYVERGYSGDLYLVL